MLQCDQAQPACSRCDRLRITCVGGGVRRFVFRAYAKDDNKSSRMMETHHPLHQQMSHSSILQMPSNALMKLSASLVDRLQFGNPGSGINWSSGTFIHELPKRLEHSDALVAATHAFILSCPCVGVTYSLSQQRLRSYVSALKATRLALTHSEEACSLDTMCAIYLLWVCQVRDAIHRVLRTDLPTDKLKELAQCCQ